MGSLSCFSSQEQGESQGIKSMQVYHEVYGVQKHIYFFIYQFLNSHVSREVYECGSANQHVCRSKCCRVFTKVWPTLGVGWPLGWAFRSCFACGAQCWSVPEFWGVLPTRTHLFSCTCFIWHKKNKGKSLPVWKTGECNNLLDFIFIYLFIYFLRKKIEIN